MGEGGHFCPRFKKCLITQKYKMLRTPNVEILQQFNIYFKDFRKVSSFYILRKRRPNMELF